MIPLQDTMCSPIISAATLSFGPSPREGVAYSSNNFLWQPSDSRVGRAWPAEIQLFLLSFEPRSAGQTRPTVSLTPHPNSPLKTETGFIQCFLRPDNYRRLRRERPLRSRLGFGANHAGNLPATIPSTSRSSSSSSQRRAFPRASTRTWARS